MEALAISQAFNPEVGTKNFNLYTNHSHYELYKYLKVVRSTIILEDGFYLY